MDELTRKNVCSSESMLWNTPQHILDSVYRVMDVDLDPCSDTDPLMFWKPPNVKAKTHYNERIDGLSKEWHGTVFMNPPYGRNTLPWITKLVTEYDEGRVTEAIALIASRTETQWYNLLSPRFIRCEPQVRLHFSNSKNSATFPSSIFYLGNNEQKFCNEFKQFGNIVGCICQTTFTRGKTATA